MSVWWLRLWLWNFWSHRNRGKSEGRRYFNYGLQSWLLIIYSGRLFWHVLRALIKIMEWILISRSISNRLRFRTGTDMSSKWAKLKCLPMRIAWLFSSTTKMIISKSSFEEWNQREYFQLLHLILILGTRKAITQTHALIGSHGLCCHLIGSQGQENGHLVGSERCVIDLKDSNNSHETEFNQMSNWIFGEQWIIFWIRSRLFAIIEEQSSFPCRFTRKCFTISRRNQKL